MAPLDRKKFAALKQMHEQGFVVGLNDVAGNTTPRLDVDDLLKNHAKTFNLFLLALDKLQNMDFSNIMSYFQISGIHGFPKVLWNNVKEKNLGKNDSGYCAHGATNFPTWHRPYVAMIEQALFIAVVEIADTYDDPQVKADYQAAALEFRLPFWDYFRPRGGAVSFPGIVDDGVLTAYPYDYRVPDICTIENVMVRKPGDNSLKPMPNPLHHFNFKTMSSDTSEMNWKFLDEDTDMLLWHEQTSRHPWGVKPNFKWNNPDRLNMTLNELRMDTNRVALDMITQDYYKVFDKFSTQGTPRKVPDDLKNDPHKNAIADAWGGASGSLEAIHGLYHGLIGGLTKGGHMGRVATAAFDPVFWLHHNQIERMFSIWQAAHASDKGGTNWFSKPSEAKASLYPFVRGPNTDGETYWSSNSAKDHTTFGHRFNDAKSTPGETKANFEKLYRWSVPKGRISDGAKPPPEMEPFDLSDSEFFPTNARPLPPHKQAAMRVASMPQALAARAQIPEVAVSNGEETAAAEYYDWYIDDEIDRMAMNGSFAILYFIKLDLNSHIDDLPDWSAAPTLAGASYIFAAPTEACDNCFNQAQQGVKVRNTVPITSQLLDFVTVGELPSLHPDDVRPFLEKRLKWRIITVNQEVVDPADMRAQHGLKISVSFKKTTGADAEPEIGRERDIVANIVANAS